MGVKKKVLHGSLHMARSKVNMENKAAQSLLRGAYHTNRGAASNGTVSLSPLSQPFFRKFN
jgi:hypothetical protein